MMKQPQDRSELVGALLAAEFADAGLDTEAMRCVHTGVHQEWLSALESTGMFDVRAMAEIAACWSADPALLRDALLAEADELTRRRCLAAWASFDTRPFAAVSR
ncbi:hypothetical protein AB0G00_05625 [Nocardia salmonicida]|uniref:hypothetical protein n=1 Tax=Nocardia TaxID=1817 RepID=UPI0026587CD2|nr:hypothetical protein [Nocardia sp. PE-7]WKG10563.1 hypothetical protein QX204_03420 [Nocardia sp. PE-7]